MIMEILKFESDYLNGKKHGKVKKYDEEGKLDFDGEYLNGNKWNGKEYKSSQYFEFVFNYSKGKKNGIVYDKKGYLIFEDEYSDYFTKRKRYYPNGKLKIEGTYNFYLNKEINEKEYIYVKEGKFKKYYDNGILKF